ncbi:transposase [Cellvibrio japonicus]|uniref:transposase n=1 Tax=Cellvibrio japonicus TaxID=155077 RepID=UPI0011D14DB5|nr:transposase [Cellvibrio japonicus]QEI14624.1 transposase [Cellvibrio japonicus]QEI18203.1 transposase [Cellvibrio japonicus]
MAIADRHGLPVGLFVGSASPHEVTLVEDTLDSCYTQAVPEKVIGDGAYDSDRLDERLRDERGMKWSN